MKAKLAPEHLAEFVAHSIATLPDSLRLRKTCLVSLLYLLPRDAIQERTTIKVLLTSLNQHESDQLKLQLTPRHDGR